MHSVQGAQALCRSFSGLIDLNVRDGDGKTAKEIARNLGVQGVWDVFRGYWEEDEGMGMEDREEDFVYDVYCLDETHKQEHANVNVNVNMNDPEPSSRDHHHSHLISQHGPAYSSRNENDVGLSAPQNLKDAVVEDEQEALTNTKSVSDTTNSTAEEEDSGPMEVNMRGGVGYWVNGELVLDVHPNADMDDSDVEDDDYDSNREDCDANDYPDEDIGDSSGDENNPYCNSFIDREMGPPRVSRSRAGHSDADSDSDDEEDVIDFRNRPMDLNDFKIGYEHQHGFGGGGGGDGGNFQDDDEDDGDYRGFMYADSNNRWSSENIDGETEAYDPDLDGEDST